MAGDPDLYEATLNVLEARLGSLESGTPAAGEHGSWTQSEADAAIAELQADEAALRTHWQLGTQTVADGAPVVCGACGEPRDCSAARALFSKYRS